MTEKLNISQIVRNKLVNYEIPIPTGAWSDFEKKLKSSDTSLMSQSGRGFLSTTLGKVLVIATLFVVPAIAAFYLLDFGKEQRDNLIHKRKNSSPAAVQPIIQNEKDKTEKIINYQPEAIDKSDFEEEVPEREYIFNPVVEGNQIYFGPAESNKENITKFRMLIRDRKGKLIFESNNEKKLWNGKIKGKDKYAQDGMYDWFIIIIDTEGDVYRRHGKVKLEMK